MLYLFPKIDYNILYKQLKKYNMNYIEEIKELKKRKLNNEEIAEHLGITKSQVRKLLNDEYEELNDSSYSPYSNDMYSYSNDDSDISDIVSTVRGQF